MLTVLPKYDYEVIAEQEVNFFHICIDDWYRTHTQFSNEIPNPWDIFESDVNPYTRTIFDIVVTSEIIKEHGFCNEDTPDELFELTSMFIGERFDQFYPKMVRDVLRYLNSRHIFFYFEEAYNEEYNRELFSNSPLQEVW